MTRDTEETMFRGYRIRVEADRVVVLGPRRTMAEFNNMATARKFIRLLNSDRVHA